MRVRTSQSAAVSTTATSWHAGSDKPVQSRGADCECSIINDVPATGVRHDIGKCANAEYGQFTSSIATSEQLTSATTHGHQFKYTGCDVAIGQRA
jgi:hypothetical protein